MVRSCEETNNIVCPLCGHEINEIKSFNIWYNNRNIDELKCDKCGRIFELEVHISLLFSTYSKE